MTRRVLITYEDSLQHSHSVLIRAKQIGFALQKYMQVHVTPLSQCQKVKNTLVIVVKPLKHNLLRRFLGKGNTIILDILDTVHLIDPEPNLVQKFFYSPTHPDILSEIDGAIFPTQKSQQYYQHLFKHRELCTTLYLPWDIRLKSRNVKPRDDLQIACWKPKHSVIHHSLENISFFPVPLSQPKKLPLEHYNAHYSIKPEHPYRQYAPLDNIVMASAISALPITLENDPDIELLTRDYPYQSPNREKEEIEDTIDFMHETLNEWEWNQALDIMADIRQKTSIIQSAKDYYTYIKQLI